MSGPSHSTLVFWKAIAAFGFFISHAIAAIHGGDDFNDNSVDASKWGADRISGNAVLTETRQRLEYTSPASASSQSIYRPWILNRPSYQTNWEVTLELHHSAVLTEDGYVSMGLEIFSPFTLSRSCYMSFYASKNGSGAAVRGFDSMLIEGSNESGYRANTFTGDTGAIRIVFDAATKILSFYHATGGPAANPEWIFHASYGLGGAGGASANTSWGMSETDEFQIAVFGFSRNHATLEGTVWADQFNAFSKITANTRSVTAVSGGGGTLNGTVYPGGLPTTAFFEYTTAADFSTFATTPPVQIDGTVVAPVTHMLDGLDAGTTYYVRLKASNTSGTHTGGTVSFSTPPYRLAVDETSGHVVVSPLQESYESGSVVTLTATPAAGSSFLSWSGDASGSTNPLTLVMDGNKSVTANFTVGLAEALDAPHMTFTSGGASGWFGQGLVTRDGTPAAQSGRIGASRESWFETSVTGSGEVAFWWKVSSEPSDYLEFHINGIRQPDRISGLVDWHRKSYHLGEGVHTLRWRYVKDFIFDGGEDAGWVDGITWTPGASGFELWRTQLFSPEELEDPLISGPDADPDGDGMPNLLEYALGTLPKDASSRGLPAGTVETIGENRYLTLTIAKPDPVRTDLLYTVRVSPDLVQWFSGAVHTTVLIDNATTLKVRDNFPLSPETGSRFMRLEVETR